MIDSSTNLVRTGVIGVGMMGQRHCRIYSNVRHSQLVGVCDPNVEAGERVAQQYDAAYFKDLDAMLDQVDAVSLVTPTPLHYDLALQCLEKGVHVLIEKPITETLEQAQALVKIAEAGSQIVQVGHIERFNPAYIELKNVLKDMTVLAVNLRRLSAYEHSNKDVNVILDLMIHDIDLALDLMGEDPVNVSAHGLSAFSDVVDHASAHMNFGGGSLLSMTASRVTEHKIRNIEVTAADSFVECDLLNKNIFVHRRTSGQFLNDTVQYRQESIVERIHVPFFEPLLLEIEHFIDCIRKNETPQVSARDGLDALTLATAIQDKIDTQLNATRSIAQMPVNQHNGMLATA